MCRRLFLNKLGDFRPAILLQKRLRDKSFPVNFAKLLRTLFFIEHLPWLHLTLERHQSTSPLLSVFINKFENIPHI